MHGVCVCIFLFVSQEGTKDVAVIFRNEIDPFKVYLLNDLIVLNQDVL